MAENTQYVDRLANALLSMDKSQAAAVMSDCSSAEDGIRLMEDTVFKALQVIGEGWDSGMSSLAQIYMAGIICEELIDEYLPVAGDQHAGESRIAIAVLQDHHLLGKRILASVLHAAGYHFLDLGHGFGPDELAELAIKNEIEILLVSTLMLPSALAVRNLTDALKRRGSAAKVIVGGAPFRFDPELWNRVGAHAFGYNATDAPAIIAKAVKGDA